MTNDYGNLELHQVLLRAMKDLDQICRENGLKYYLYAGSLLGAIVHKGFIPWDDDVDIVMFPSDFERLTKIIEEQYARYYKVMTFYNTENWFSMMNKLQVLGTNIIYNNGTSSPVFIDICVLHSVPDGKFNRWLHEKMISFVNLGLYVLSGEIKLTSIKAHLTIGLLAKIGKERLGRLLSRIMSLHDKTRTKYVGILCNTLTQNPYTGLSGYQSDITKRYDHEFVELVQFEDTKFMTISNPQLYLSRMYGIHYMDPYPEEKRVTKHNIKSFHIEPWVEEHRK